MRTHIIILGLFLLSITSFCQIQVSRANGGTNTLKLGYGIVVNKESTLTREYIILNDDQCPIGLTNVGISVSYNSGFSLVPTGLLLAKEKVAAYEIFHVLYDVFGEHIKTLNSTEVADFVNNRDYTKSGSWYANENQVKEYLTCVSFVKKVRMADGQIWVYDYSNIKAELDKIKFEFDETYAPKPVPDK